MHQVLRLTTTLVLTVNMFSEPEQEPSYLSPLIPHLISSFQDTLLKLP